MIWALVGALLPGCRAGLPPEPPGADPADPDAPPSTYRAAPDPYVGGFAGEAAPVPGGPTGPEHGGHEHAGHSPPEPRR